MGLAFLYDVKKYTAKEEFLADKDKHFSINFSAPKFGGGAQKMNNPIPMLGQLGLFVYHTMFI